jgi:hypothetical protein
MYIYDNISLKPSQMRNVSDRSCRENEDAYYVQKNFPEIRAVFEII